MEVSKIDDLEVFPSSKQIRLKQRMFIDRPKGGSQSSIKIDQGVMPQGLEEHATTTGLQGTPKFTESQVEIQVMNDARSANDIKRVVREMETLGIHHHELGGRIATFRPLASRLDCVLRDVDTHDICAELRELYG